MAALFSAPGCGRAATMRLSNAASDPREASRDAAPTRSAVFARSIARLQREAADRDRHLHSVDEREPFLRSQSRRPDPRAPQRLRRGPLPAPHPHAALAHQAERQMRERSEIARRPDRTLRRNDRQDVGREHRDERLDGRDANAGVPARQRVGAQRHHRPHDGIRQSGSDARGVASNQVALERLDLSRRDRHVGELAEARRHAVDRLPRSHRAVDHAARRRDRTAGRRETASRCARRSATATRSASVRPSPESRMIFIGGRF